MSRNKFSAESSLKIFAGYSTERKSFHNSAAHLQQLQSTDCSGCRPWGPEICHCGHLFHGVHTSPKLLSTFILFLHEYHHISSFVNWQDFQCILCYTLCYTGSGIMEPDNVPCFSNAIEIELAVVSLVLEAARSHRGGSCN